MERGGPDAAGTTTPDVDARDWETGTVSNDGVAIHYYRTGDRSAPPVVLCHGLFDSGECVTQLGSTLAGDHDVITVDARGHGQSDAPEEGYDVDTRVADLRTVLDALDLQNPVLYGHSFGGNTVASFAAASPDRPSGVVLEDPAGMLSWTGERDSEAVADEQRREIASWHGQSKANLREGFDDAHEPWHDALARSRHQVSTAISAVAREGYRPPEATFPDISAPTLILRADVEEAQRQRDRERAALLTESRLRWVGGAGHCVRRDAFPTVAGSVQSFLTRMREE